MGCSAKILICINGVAFIVDRRWTMRLWRAILRRWITPVASSGDRLFERRAFQWGYCLRDVRQTNTLALPSPLLTTHPLFVLLLLFTASGEMWISVGGVQCSFGIERAARMRDAEEVENGGMKEGRAPRLALFT